MSDLAGLSGALVGLGVVVLVAGLRRVPPAGPLRLPQIDWRRVAPSVAAAVVVGAVTRWPVAAALAALGAGFLPTLIGPVPEAAASVRAEAVAAWTEMLADTMAASAGLTQAIVVSAERAPVSIRPAVAALAARLAAQVPLEAALREFASALADPSADLVVAALIAAARGQAGRLTEVLSGLAASVREEVAMRGRVATSRVRVRSGIRVVAGFSVAFGLLLLVVAHSYLAPFGTATGEVVLAAVGGLYAAGLWLMAGMARPQLPPRLLGERR